MTRIYAVMTEDEEGRRFSTYKVAAPTFEKAIAKVTKDQSLARHGGDYVERIAEVHILASES